jgi:hypothetical protein
MPTLEFIKSKLIRATGKVFSCSKGTMNKMNSHERSEHSFYPSQPKLQANVNEYTPLLLHSSRIPIFHSHSAFNVFHSHSAFRIPPSASGIQLFAFCFLLSAFSPPGV